MYTTHHVSHEMSCCLSFVITLRDSHKVNFGLFSGISLHFVFGFWKFNFHFSAFHSLELMNESPFCINCVDFFISCMRTKCWNCFLHHFFFQWIQIEMHQTINSHSTKWNETKQNNILLFVIIQNSKLENGARERERRTSCDACNINFNW